MVVTLASLLKLNILTLGRRIFALQAVRELAVGLQLDALVQAIDANIAHDRNVMALMAGRAPAPVLVPTASARDTDIQIDRLLVLIYSIMDNFATDADNADIAVMALALKQKVFPNELKGHVHLPWVDQLAANERALDALKAEANQPAVTALGLVPNVVRLERLNQTFARALKPQITEVVPWKDVKTGLALGHELYCGIAVRIMSLYVDPAQAEQRAKLMGPILAQNEAIRQYRRRRKRVVDVNPDTGETLPEGAEATPDTDAAS